MTPHAHDTRPLDRHTMWLVSLLAGCAAPAPIAPVTAPTPEPPATSAPSSEGLDGPGVGTGQLPRAGVIGRAPFQGGALALGLDQVLRFELGQATPRVVDRDVVFVPVAREDGGLACWGAMRNDAMVLVCVDHEGARWEVDAGLVSIGALAFDPDHARVAFVGAGPLGVAGVWTATSGGARCWTNCSAAVGDGLGGVAPLPDAAMRFEGDLLMVPVGGQAQRLPVGAP